jgi:peptidoglycan/xylan/chitin deacetylase (PgdA/CDA1 family)
MYHRTPKGAPDDRWDVPLHVFKDQIRALIDAGISFVEISATQDIDLLASGMNVAVTLDDGHASNASAFEFLASKQIKPTAFIVARWSREFSGYLSAKDLADLSPICTFGAHGSTHTNLTILTPFNLHKELAESRAYVEDALSLPVNSMALPGGKGNSQVLNAAVIAGYRLVCNSVADINRHGGLSVNRPCVTSDEDTELPLRWATAGRAYWLAKRLRHAVTGAAARLVGERGYAVAVEAIKALNIK